MSRFTTDAGVFVPALSVAQMREVDRIAVEQATPKLSQMMENAGQNLASAAVDFLGSEWPEVSIAVFAGAGSNGGGGVTAARHLANRGGNVILILSREPDPKTIVAQQLGIFLQTRGRLAYSSDFESGLIIDALIGYGLTDAPHGWSAEMITGINEAAAPVVSLDVPSGLDGDSGESLGVAVAPERTVTLALPKTGLRVEAAGDIWLGDLGIPVGVFRQTGVEPPRRLFQTAPLVHLNREAL
jgi:NAD(P)H-hydrate epimerase